VGQQPAAALLVSGVLAAGVLIALAVPALRLETTQNSTESYPRSLAVIRAYHKIQKAFPGDAVAAQVVVAAPDVRSAGVRAAIAELTRRALATGEMFRPIEVDVNRAGTVALVSVPIAGQKTSGLRPPRIAAMVERTETRELETVSVGSAAEATAALGRLLAVTKASY
jgi:putative drug exporter of the RND superfamily